MLEKWREISVEPAGNGSRIDVFLSGRLMKLTRSHIGRLVSEGLVLMDGRRVKSGTRVKEGARIHYRVPLVRPLTIQPEAIPLDIVYEDANVAVVNKPSGMVVHPSAGHYTGTLVHALLHHYQRLSTLGGMERPGIVHRLDKDTSGLLIVAKDEQSHVNLSEQLRDRTLTRLYYAVAHGRLREDAGIIETDIGRHPTDRKRMSAHPRKGRHAITEFEVVERLKGFTFLRLRLKTGRTHQIRVHLAFRGHPVVGDSVYGGKKRQRFKGMARRLIERQALHAYKIGFIHPQQGETMKFQAPLPDDIEELLAMIRES